MINPFVFKEPSKKEVFKIEKTDINFEKVEKYEISRNINDNEVYIKQRFNIPKNNDVVLRKFTVKGDKKAFAVFYDGMVSTDYVNSHIIETMQYIPYLVDETLKVSKSEFMEKFISNSQATVEIDIEKAVDEVNFGGCAVFVDGIDVVFTMDVRSWGHRGIEKPENEQSIYGPQEAFNEMLRNNSALVRKIIKTEKLICEGLKVGTVSKTRGVLMYINDIANEKLINEVKRRINNIKIDYIISIEEVGMLIEDDKFSVTNQVLSTERPDRVARYLADGRVAFMLSGSPNVLIFPTNAFELTHTASDAYMKPVFANMARTIRLIAMFFSVLFPGLYLAMTLFHQEMIPTYLIYSISASRENVPFPSIVELFLMDLSFEMIREAGLRMPGTLGSTLGIVGGLILGQAAVSAKIVSPIMIIVIAITGIGSYATTNYSLGWSYRVLRIAFMIFGAILGFYGIGIGLFLYSVYLGSLTNFGIGFLSPMPGSFVKRLRDGVFTKPIWDNEYRPEYLQTKNTKKEPKISRPWTFRRK